MKPSLIQLKTNPVIAAVRDTEMIDRALDSSVNVIFVMGGCISGVQKITKLAQKAGKQVFLHIELIKGLGRDKEAVEYIAHEICPKGVVSTKPQLLQAAAKLNLLTVLQVFMIDSQAFESGLHNMATLQPHAVELMPGLMPRVAAEIKSHVDVPLIAAGLIRQSHEIDAMLAAGCAAVAVSEQALWNYQPEK